MYIFGIGAIGCVAFVIFAVMTYAGGCGSDDGPFKAQRIPSINPSQAVQVFPVEHGKLLIDNRADSLSPVLTLIENNKVKWTLDMDVSKTKGYENCRISKISNVTITQKDDPIKLNFTAVWTYGAEAGSMEIYREDGDNSFCLSW